MELIPQGPAEAEGRGEEMLGTVTLSCPCPSQSTPPGVTALFPAQRETVVLCREEKSTELERTKSQ